MRRVYWETPSPSPMKRSIWTYTGVDLIFRYSWNSSYPFWEIAAATEFTQELYRNRR
jgi:hypothetical protein